MAKAESVSSADLIQVEQTSFLTTTIKIKPVQHAGISVAEVKSSD